jgi:hypothetical protein
MMTMKPSQSILCELENACITLMARFTTIQAIGSPIDIAARRVLAVMKGREVPKNVAR